MQKHLVLKCPHLQYIREKYAPLFHRPTRVQFFWQEYVIGGAKFILKI